MDKNVEKDVKKALKMIRKKNDLSAYFISSDYSKIFAFSNEWIPGYLPFFPINGNPALTVTGSLDQTLYLALNGATSIDTFDKNPFVRYYAELKLAALKCLSRDQFLEFIPTQINSEATFSYSIFKEIFTEMAPDAQDFWYAIYQSLKNPSQISYLFFEDNLPLISKWDYYTEEAFPSLKEQLQKIDIHFYTADFSCLPSSILKRKGYYGTVFLSNIFDWSDYRPFSSADYEIELNTFYSYVHFLIGPLLMEDGVCLARYYFGDSFDSFRTSLEHHYLPQCPKQYVKVRGIPSVDLYYKSKTDTK